MIAAMIAAASTIASAMVYVDTKTKSDDFELANLLIRTVNTWAENQKLRN